MQLAVWIIRQHGIHEPLIQTDFSSIIGDAEHIVLGGIHNSGVNRCGPLGQTLHHLLLELRRLHHNGFILCLRARKIQLIRCFDIRNLLEHVHQLREIKELGEPCSSPIAGAFGVEFVKILFVDFLN